MPDNFLVVNAEGPETRVGVVEKGRLVEYFVERKRERGIVGNIYKGKVVRVLPGMQAAFVDLGNTVEKSAFLYVGDVIGAGGQKKLFEDEGDSEDGDEDGDPASTAARVARRTAPRGKIEDLLKERQEVLVQAVKDPIGLKGARVTGYLSLPGRHLVFMPTIDHIVISRRISSDKERKRLREIVE